jgi:hypothetical protein
MGTAGVAAADSGDCMLIGPPPDVETSIMLRTRAAAQRPSSPVLHSVILDVNIDVTHL